MHTSNRQQLAPQAAHRRRPLQPEGTSRHARHQTPRPEPLSQHGRWSVDDVVVVRMFKETGDGKAKPALEIPLHLSDGDVERSCSFSAYLAFPSRRIARALLRVDGRLLYDEDPKT